MDATPDASAPTTTVVPTTCPTCHQPVLPHYYFCPNCGANLHAAPLSTNVPTQVWIYVFSIILPMIAFLAITKWPGVTYVRSSDPKARQIGFVAWFLIIASTLFTIYYVYTWTEATIQSSVDQINLDMSGQG